MSAFEAYGIVLGGGLIVGIIGLILTRFVKQSH